VTIQNNFPERNAHEKSSNSSFGFAKNKTRMRKLEEAYMFYFGAVILIIASAMRW